MKTLKWNLHSLKREPLVCLDGQFVELAINTLSLLKSHYTHKIQAPNRLKSSS